MKNRLEAFTLIEVLITLVITGIAVAMAGYAFSTVRSMSDKVNAGINGAGSSYFLLSDVERLFSSETEPTYRFNEIKFSAVSYDFGVEYTVRKQNGRLDTFSNHLLQPIHGVAIDRQLKRPMDSLVFRFGDSEFKLKKQGSLADHVNENIGHGED